MRTLLVLALLPLLVAAQDSFLKTHCVACHSASKPKADLDLESTPDLSKPDVREAWLKVLARTQAQTMPPAGKPQPAKAERDAFVAALEAKLAPFEKAQQAKEGRAVLRRLNRTEYENTLRDLLGVPMNVKDLLPADAISHGFDNLGESLNISSVQMQQYLEAADAALTTAIAKKPKVESATKTFSYATGRNEQFIGKHWLKRPDGAVVFYSSASYPDKRIHDYGAPATGTYRVTFRGESVQSRDPIPFGVYAWSYTRGAESNLEGYTELPVGGVASKTMEITLRRGQSVEILPHGLKFNAYQKGETAETYKGPGIAVLDVTIEGPLAMPFPSRGHTLLFGDLPLVPRIAAKAKPGPNTIWDTPSKDPLADARKQLPVFIAAAFRKPVTSEQTAPYLALFEKLSKNGAGFEEAMKATAIAVLCAPDFLYLKETPGPLDDYSLASRLSYFLWRTMPDEELLNAAAKKQLSTPAGLKAQTERLLNHPNSKRFTKDFTDAWLNLRDIDFTMPDTTLYPEFDQMLRHSMMEETHAFFDEVRNNNMPARNYIASDFAMLNVRMAKHYGMDGVSGVEFRKITLPKDSVRGGLLSQASVLKVSANGTNTSPVVRGVYVLERFMGTVPSPPPANVPAVEPDIRGASTVRELLAKHRSVETCAGCHRLIDPPGFALESFDAIGGYRTAFRVAGQAPKGKRNVAGTRYYDGLAVDASGETIDGLKFNNYDEFRKLLLQDPDRFAKCLTEKLLTFATGREPGIADRAEIAKLVKAGATNDHRVGDMIHGVVQSELFRNK